MASTLRIPKPISIDIMRNPTMIKSVVNQLESPETEGLIDSVVNMIKDPNSPRTKKASLITAYYLASSSQRSASSFATRGAVPLLLEMLVDSDKSTSEKALGVLDAILASTKGREEAYVHALTMPVLIKKMFRVSDIATGFAVSAIWKMLKNCSEEKRLRLAQAALSVGAFQKLLLLLQVGCSEGTKAKASELLRILNYYKEINGECVDTSDLRGIKRN